MECENWVTSVEGAQRQPNLDFSPQLSQTNDQTIFNPAREVRLVRIWGMDPKVSKTVLIIRAEYHFFCLFPLMCRERSLSSGRM